MRAITFALLLCSCQPGPEGPQGPAGPPGPMGAMGNMGLPGSGGSGFVDGQRLKQTYWTGEDGSKMPAVIVDTKHNVACERAPATDGAMRCLPPAVKAQRIYRTTDCTDPLMAAGLNGTPALGRPYGAPEVWRMTPAGALPSLYYILQADGKTCVAARNDPPTTEAAMYSVAIIPPAEFVKFTAP